MLRQWRHAGFRLSERAAFSDLAFHRPTSSGALGRDAIFQFRPRSRLFLFLVMMKASHILREPQPTHMWLWELFLKERLWIFDSRLFFRARLEKNRKFGSWSSFFTWREITAFVGEFQLKAELTFSFRQLQHDTPDMQVAFDAQRLLDLQIRDHHAKIPGIVANVNHFDRFDFKPSPLIFFLRKFVIRRHFYFLFRFSTDRTTRICKQITELKSRKMMNQMKHRTCNKIRCKINRGNRLQRKLFHLN